ncbi:MAG TPA: PEP-CTERM sorting domain-containing protein [Tepidisphaeraceae bacterium]|nr:PEP-CTERM sorting domain-containing protein [Tepidisphaeraceae bacterium]
MSKDQGRARAAGFVLGSAGRRRRGAVARAVAAVVVGAVGVTAGAATISWTGTGGPGWATANSWSPSGAGPQAGDVAAFGDTGSTAFVGDVTSVVNVDRTVFGLTFKNAAGKYHTLDLNARALTVNGNLHFNTDTSTATTTTVRNGTLNVTGAFSTINVGRAASANAKGAADWSGLTALSATIAEVNVGVAATGSADGTLTLGASNTITATRVSVGSVTNASDSLGTLHLGLANTLNVGELTVGRNNATGTVDVVTGGHLNLGTASARTLLQVGVMALAHDDNFTSTLNLTDATFTGHLSSVIVGQKTGGGFGDAVGVLNAGVGGTVNIGAAGNAANVYVGRKLTGGSDSGAVGFADFSGLASLTASLNELTVGTAQTGTALGTLKLAAANTISANTIVVGSGGKGANVLAMGRGASAVTAGSLTVGQGLSHGTVTIGAGGSLALGTTTARTDVFVGVANVGDNDDYAGRLDLAGGSMTAHLNNVTVGQREVGGFGSTTGVFVGGNGGAVTIGAPGQQTANVYVGRKLTGGSDSGAVGNVDFSGLSSLTASVDQFTIGTALTGWASGNVKLPATTAITANAIVVGSASTNYNDQAPVNTLVLGRTANDIRTPSLAIGQHYASGSVTVAAAGATVTLGSLAQRTTLEVGVGNTGTNEVYTGTLNLAGAVWTAHLGSVTVGQKDGGGFGDAVGILDAGAGGTVDIGGAAPNAANLHVGRRLSGGSDAGAVGTADFSGLTSLTASLDAVTVGTAITGFASGTLRLAGANTIDARTITVGSLGGGSSLLVLGRSNTIQADQLTLGVDNANASLTIPAGATLTLGSPARRTAVTVSTGNPVNAGSFGATVDLGNATVVAYLGNVAVGMRSAAGGGSKSGTLTFGNSPGNFVDADAITLANFSGSTGTLNFGGGALVANSIAAGGGTANFNWTGGRLSVGTFGTAAQAFALKNTGTGTLSPGATAGAVATTTVYGAYTQGASATTAIDIAGTTPGSGNDAVSITGAATLAGNLNVNLAGGFTPSVGQSFVVATYASRTGTFNYVAPPTLPAGVAMSLDYTSPTQLVLRAVTPAAADFVAAQSSTTFGAAGNWNTGTAPGTATVASINHAGAGAQTVSVSADTTVHGVWLQSTGGTLTLAVPAGVRLAAANQIVVGPRSVLRVDGSVADSGGVTVNSGGRAELGATQSLRALTVNAGGTAQITGAGTKVVTTKSLKLETGGGGGAGAPDEGVGGSLDLGTHALVVDYDAAAGTPAAAVRAAILRAHNGGSWQGTGGIGSAAVAASQGNSAGRLAVGYVEAGVLLGSAAGGSVDLGAGQSVTVDGTALIVRTTLAGDADLNGAVGLNDLVRLANHYGSPTATGWFDGDFDYNGVVALNDLVFLANNYGGTLAGVLPAGDRTEAFAADWALAQEIVAGAASVPEPGAVAVIGVVAGAAMTRRRRRRA